MSALGEAIGRIVMDPFGMTDRREKARAYIKKVIENPPPAPTRDERWDSLISGTMRMDQWPDKLLLRGIPQPMQQAAPYQAWGTNQWAGSRVVISNDATALTVDDLDVAGEIRKLREMACPTAVIKCQYCGQWAAAYTSCHKCGAPTC